MKDQPTFRRGWRFVVVASAMLAGVLTPAASAGSSTVVEAMSGTAPRITTASKLQYQAGGYNVLPVTATGSPTPTLSASGTLPPGLLFEPNKYGTAVILGQNLPPVAGHAFTLTVTATNGVTPNAVQHLTLIAGTTTTTTSVSASPSPAVAGQPVTYTAKVAPVPDGGTVLFSATFPEPNDLSGSTNIAGCVDVPVNTSTGTATCSSSYLLAQSYKLYASYSGSGLFLSSLVANPVKLVVNPRPASYWLATTNGRVFGLGTAPSLGNANTSASRGIAATPSGQGYYVVGADGGVFTFGDARFRGSVPGLGKRVSNIVAIVPTLDGKGYYLLGSDGGVFTFGDARFHGSLPGLGIRTQHVVGMVANPADTGYLLVGRDGGVFTFGNTKFYGSLPGLGIHVTNIRGILAASAGTGYVLVGSDGGVFNFGTGVKFYGSLPGENVRVNNIVGIALTQDEDGYYMAGSDGKVYGFGTAQVAPPPDGLQPNLPVAAIAGIPATPPPVTLAGEIFQRFQQYLPDDRFSYGSEPLGALFGFVPDSSVNFSCLTCGQNWPYGFSIIVFRSHDAALGYAVSTIKQAELVGDIQFPYGPQYVAGDAVLGPAPDRFITAFGRAVGQPVVTVAV
jgi:Bacterial Ig-like domain (group 3)